MLVSEDRTIKLKKSQMIVLQISLASGGKSSMLVSEEDNQAEEEPNDSLVNIAGLWRQIQHACF